MMRIRLFVNLVRGWMFVTLLVGSSMLAQETESRFEALEVAGKDEMRRVSCMLQDHIGFMWLGTSNGLYRYDGYELKAYQHDSEIASSLPDNYVYSLYEDQQNRLWVGTDAGLSLLDRKKGDFQTIPHRPRDLTTLSDAAVLSIWENGNGELWVGTRSGLNRIRFGDEGNEGSIRTFSYQIQQVEYTQGLSIQTIYLDSKGDIWLGTGSGLLKVSPDGAQIQAFTESSGAEQVGLVNSIYELDEGDLLVAGTAGLRILDPLTGRFKRTPYDPNDRFGLHDARIKVIVADNLGQIWVGAEAGSLFRIDPNTKEITSHHVVEEVNPQSLISDDVLAIYIDRSGLLWASSYLYGVFKLDLIRISFGIIRRTPAVSGTLLSEDINAIAEDLHGQVWIGTERGLSLMNKSNERHHYLQHDPTDSTSLSDDAVYCLLEDREQNMWVGTLDGLNFISATSIADKRYSFRQYRHIPGSRSGLVSNDIVALLEDTVGRIWVGTSEGLTSMEPDRETFISYRHIESNPTSLSDDGIRVLFQDHEGVLWIGTENGLNSLQPNLDDGGAFSRYLQIEGDTNSLPSNTILSIAEDSRGYLWVGTEGGLCSLSPDRKQFRTYTYADGLPANDICGILQDDENSLWLSTTEGISRMKRRGDSDFYSFVNYDRSNWLPFDQFNPASYFQNKRGFVFFGSSKGLVYFHPDLIRENEFPPPVAITDFELTYLSDEERKEVELPLNISETESLTFRYRYNNMIIRFAALSFLESDRNEYAYMLEGYNDEWQYVKGQRNAPFTNLDPGTYTFRVKAANNHGMWNEKGASLKIVIRPPIYLTNAFLAFCMLLAILLVIAYGKIRTRGLEKNKKILEARVEERTAEVQRQKEELETILENLKSTQTQLVEAEKMASLGLLTAGVAHEINNPINFVSGNVEPLKRDIHDLLKILVAYEDQISQAKLQGNFEAVASLKEELDFDFLVEEIEHLLGGIQEGARRTSEIVKGLRNFSRLDEDELKLASVNEGIESTLLILGSELRERIEVILELGEVPEISCHPGKLNQVYMNVITNAIQSIEDEGKIYIRTAVEGEYVKVSIEDTGRGMTEEVQQRIFDPFFTTKEVGHGTGLGLSISFGIIENHKGKISVKSKVGAGSEFEILLPINRPDSFSS